MRHALALVAALLLAATPTASAEDAPLGVDVIALQYRTASELLPALLPIVEGRGAVIGAGDQIFVRGTPEARRDVKSMISLLDVMPRPLSIAVRQIFTRRAPGAPSAEDVVAGRVPNGTGGTFPGFSGGDQLALGHEATELPVLVRRDRPNDKQLARGRDELDAPPAIVDDWYNATLGSTLVMIPHILDSDRVSVEIVTRRPAADGMQSELRSAVEGPLGDWLDITRVLEEHAWRRSTPQDERLREQRTDNAVLVRVQRMRPPETSP
jgi:hypothetical protein